MHRTAPLYLKLSALVAPVSQRGLMDGTVYAHTSPNAPIIVSVVDFTPYLDQLYSLIADDPRSTAQRLIAYFVAEQCKYFDPIALKTAIARLKRRHAIFEAWRVELAKDFGLFREGGLSEIKAPSNLGSMSEQAFFQLVD